MSFKPLLVLFVSTGNAARSLIAEALLNAKGSDHFRARSAGVAPLDKIPCDTLMLLENAGLETQKLHPKSWKDFYAAAQLVPVDVIVTLSEEAKDACAVNWPGDPVRVHWAVDDPLGAEKPDVREWKFRKCFSVLETRINTLVRSRLPATAAEMLVSLKAIGMVV